MLEDDRYGVVLLYHETIYYLPANKQLVLVPLPLQYMK